MRGGCGGGWRCDDGLADIWLVDVSVPDGLVKEVASGGRWPGGGCLDFLGDVAYLLHLCWTLQKSWAYKSGIFPRHGAVAVYST